MPTDAQKRADRRYKRDKTRQICLRFYPADRDVWSFLSAQDNRQGYIKGLIRREMEGCARVSGATDAEGHDHGTAG